jgi:mono/diheme cytochrome c family protein
MPDTEGWGENKPTGRVSILEDTDGDGRMDKSTVFLDKLVLPRAVGFAGGGVLIGTPPKLLFCPDTDGDGRADSVQTLVTDFGLVENPENSANGLLYNLDNWIYCANYEKRIRLEGGQFRFEAVPDMGQFGIARDDWGRLFFNTNSDYLRGALIPPHYSSRNPRSPIKLADTQVAKDQTLWPAHAATVNRGYREGFLRPDGTLLAFTAACGPCIYRANLFPPDFYGNAFVCEATSNLVRRAIITEKDGILTAKNAYDRREFIASTYERFRPVNLTVGPDGALYVVDMHHGLIQHRISITDYAKSEYLKKQLNKHLLTGRIFRIVPEGADVPRSRPQLSKATTRQLVEQLKHPNGWWRDTAQRLLVERNDPAARLPLREIALHDADPLHRATALWTLDGMQKLDENTLCRALMDKDAKVRVNAIRLSEWLVVQKDRGFKANAAVQKLAADGDPQVRRQFVLSLGRGFEQTIARMLSDAGDDANLREAAISDLSGAEVEYLRRRLADPTWATKSAARWDVTTDVARSVTRRDDAKEVTALVELIGEQPPERRWQQLAMLEAIPEVRHDEFGSRKLIALDKKPEALARLASSADPSLNSRAERVAALFDWPGKPTPPRPKPAPLTARQQELFEIGRTQFTLICAQCHKPDGLGQEGKAPPLVNSPWVLGSDKRVVRIVLHGLRGPVQVAGGQTFNLDLKLDMPALKALSDDQIAGVLTYVRRSWGHEAPAVDPATVATIREWNQARRDGWTMQELLQIK